ncbi:ParD-like family protein [Ideonella azotifigens]|uniref:ParD-like family protein n=1 Tax=Ideonella azotifigens TaxID=513160 RepID=A0ABP3VLQ4_9BURK|nr:ParD-like family protein [Ideonella azotifigens]MCD2342094.1 ParD-like family protein [Ideonella azotifigens]
MGIVKISDQMHDNLRAASEALSRSINAQAEHWMRVGMLAELNPALSHGEICQLMLQASQRGDGGFAFALPEVSAAKKRAAKAARVAA